MRGHTLGCAAGLALAAALALPAEAKKKPPADPGAKTCELNWKTSFGAVELKQTYSGSGVLSREEISIRRTFPSSGSPTGTLWLSGHTYSAGATTSVSRSIYLGLAGPNDRGKNRQLIVAMPDGEPVVVPMDYGASFIPLPEAQLARLLSARQRLSYKMVQTGRDGAKDEQIGEGWLDLSGLADLPLAGLAQSADLARATLDKARAGPAAPCALVYAAEMNSMDSDEAVRKWLTIDCGESWAAPQGEFVLGLDNFTWNRTPRDGIGLRFSANLRINPRIDQQQFVTDPLDPNRFGQLHVAFNARDWGLNYRVNSPIERERQSGEVRRGKYVARKWLGIDGRIGFFWSEFSQLLAGEGDLQFTAFDTISGKVERASLPWSEVLAAEDELRKGLARMIERERDPLGQCKVQVDADYGQEEIIVT